MTKRREMRVNVITYIYQYDLLDENMELDIEIENEDEKSLFLGCIEKRNELFKIIEKNLVNYSLNRLSYIDRAILLLATYELKYTDTATNIIINEAVEITKIYSDLDDEKQHKFNNKVIDSISKDLRK